VDPLAREERKLANSQRIRLKVRGREPGVSATDERE
jgi:hypothetical protein